MSTPSSALVFSTGAAGPVLADDPGILAWQDHALCAQVDPELWFPEKGGSTKDAKAVCRECPVRAECLEYALASQQEWGVWGGTNEHERQAILRAKKRQPGAAEPPAAGAA